MKQILLLLLICSPLFAAAQFYDDFSGSTFPNSPHWQGDVDAFGLTNDSLLQSKPILATYLSAKNTLAYNVIWEFGIQLGFNPSRNNQLRIYLIADRDSLTKPLNGYFIQIGESGNTDRYQLYKQEGEKISLIMSSLPKHRIDPSRVNSKIKVSRDMRGNWKLYTAQNNKEFTLDAVGTDNSISSSKFFGIHCSFTNSNNDKFSFDYFKIDTLIETAAPPFITSTRVIDSISLEITFNKILDSLSASQINHYILTPDDHFLKATSNTDSIVLLLFADSLTTDHYNLYVSGVADYDGNLMTDTSIAFFYEAPKTPAPRDTIPPKLISTLIRDSASIRLNFNELLDKIPVADVDQFILTPGHGSPRHISVNDSIIVLSFTDSLSSGDYSLQIQRITDLNGNRMSDTIINFYYEAPQPVIPWRKLRPDSTGQVLFIDTFQHGISSLWGGQTEKFYEKYNVVKQRDTLTSPAFIHIANAGIRNRMWEAGIEVAGRLTSQNYVRLYLSSLNRSLPDSKEGYYLQVDGINKQHRYKLYRQNPKSRKLLFESEPIPDINDKIRAKIRISCDASGKWKIYTDEYDQDNFNLLLTKQGDSSVTDNTYSTSLYAGWMTRFSETRSKDYALHYFMIKNLTDIPSVLDSIPPNVFSVSILDSTSVQLIFSEKIDSVSAAAIDHYKIDPGNNIPITIKVTDSMAILRFSHSLVPGNYVLTLSNILDRAGNEMEDNRHFNLIFKEQYKAKPFDIIINEIMADPTPNNGLPPIEYVELRNLSEHDLQLKDWTYSSKSKTYQFDSVIIRANSYLLLYQEKDSVWIDGFGDSIGLSPWPGLVNNGTTLTLKNKNGEIIDAVSYESSWYDDTKKDNGGWSIERIDPYAYCRGKQNWKASVDSTGGTPGRLNSIHQESTSVDLRLIETAIIESSQIQLTFNKLIDPHSATDRNIFDINNGMGMPDSIRLLDLRNVVLYYPQDFLRGKYYQINVSNISDCAGQQASLTRELYYADTISMHDIIINEILPDPRKGGVEFVEIYNNSEKTVDIANLSLATIRTSDGKLTEKKITMKPHLMLPATYRLLSVDPASVQSHYFSPSPDAFIKMHTFPILNNSEGTVVLLTENNQIDRLDYKEDMHDPLIIDSKGISLERVNFNKGTNEEGNFKSAAESVGGATPGYQNSQYQDEEEILQEQVYLSSKTFSPDNDGFEDLLEINYQFPEGGRMATIEIYDDKGLLMKRLRRNHRLATQGTIQWNGMRDNNSQAHVGIYIILIEVYDSTGMRKLIRKTCVLASKF